MCWENSVFPADLKSRVATPKRGRVMSTTCGNMLGKYPFLADARKNGPAVVEP